CSLRRRLGRCLLGRCLRTSLRRTRLELEAYLAIFLLDQISLELPVRAAGNKTIKQVRLAFRQQLADLRGRNLLLQYHLARSEITSLVRAHRLLADIIHAVLVDFVLAFRTRAYRGMPR